MSQSRPLSILSGGVLGPWAARKNLGDELHALAAHALYAQAMLHIASRKETENPPLDALMLQLQMLVHDADVVLNELDFFRVQDELDRAVVGPSQKGWIDCLHFHARHAARAAVAKLKPSSSLHDLASIDPSSVCRVAGTNDRQVQDVKTPKPKFNKAVLSAKMTDVVEKLKSLSAMVNTLF